MMGPGDDDGDEVETKKSAAPWARDLDSAAAGAADQAPEAPPTNTPAASAAPWARDPAKINNASPAGARARSEPNGAGAQQAPWAGGGMPNWGAIGQRLGLGGQPQAGAMPPQQGGPMPQPAMHPGFGGFRPGAMNPMAAQVAQALAARKAQLEQRGMGGGGPPPVQRPPWGR